VVSASPQRAWAEGSSAHTWGRVNPPAVAGTIVARVGANPVRRR
jgi:hypothetical protein